MSYLLNIVLAFVLLQAVLSLNYVEEECINRHTDDVDNDFLLGTWYTVYRFSKSLVSSIPTRDCAPRTFTKPTPEQLQLYINYYNSDNPYSFDDNPVLVKDTTWLRDGMIMGKKAAKFFVHSAEYNYHDKSIYAVQIYEKINDDYILYQQCMMRGNTKWLLSRKNSSRYEDVAEVLQTIEPRIRWYDSQRFCAGCERYGCLD
ncbi:uncharacterized protein LOC123658596 [Melitaea cinxia]|uniref:uncharacterized protein LOC123658596 n=1 Tax=Melitaea cinxia TaxID=113334 RepID=UPI001E271430|nr:uncharacterized protein LOC123658596 [Melitaea cinxia]